MRFFDAVVEAVRRNGPDRTYACQRTGFGFEYEESVYPDDFVTEDNRRRVRDAYGCEVVDAGGAAWILFRRLVMFRPQPIYGRWVLLGREDPCTWRFDPNNLLDQVDGVSSAYGVRLVAGRADIAPWRAHFVEHSGDPGREVHLDRRFGRFPGATLEEAVWAAVKDIRQKNPRLHALGECGTR